jgi:ketosteroid isomerase-like protein
MESSQQAAVRALLKAIEDGESGRLDGLFDSAVVQIEMPNALKPHGDRRGLEQMRADFAKGAAILSRQSYEIISLIESGNNVAARVLWKGVLAIPVKSLAPGDAMTVHSAMFFTFRDGMIVEQINYDSFEPF